LSNLLSAAFLWQWYAIKLARPVAV
jgi:hypothetical protein